MKRDKPTNNRSKRHYIENFKLTNTNPTKTGDGLQRDNQLPLHLWHTSCYTCQKKPDEKSLRKGEIVITTKASYIHFCIRGHL